MATEEPNSPPPDLDLQASAPVNLPQYPELIIAAIEALNEKNGSNKSSISKLIKDTYGELSEAHSTLLSDHLSKMQQSGQLVFVNNNYMKPDPNTPPRRGRGRPPKPKSPIPPGAVISPPKPRDPNASPPSSGSGRPRGRPPKPRDTNALPPSSGSGHPRGRPTKKAKTGTSTVSQTSGTPKRRGRPPKALFPPGMIVSPSRPRGRPAKSRDPNVLTPQRKRPMTNAPSPSTGRSRGRPPKTGMTALETSQVGGRPKSRGRPPKVKA